jgi:hypothetical protein
VLLDEPKRQQSQQQSHGFDVIGFILVATFLGALEVVLDRGLEDDWFASTYILTFSVICAVAFVLMIPWEMSRRDPMIDLCMVATRQFGASFLVMLATGAILLATTQFLPQLVQQDFGYTATWAGLCWCQIETANCLLPADCGVGPPSAEAESAPVAAKPTDSMATDTIPARSSVDLRRVLNILLSFRSSIDFLLKSNFSCGAENAVRNISV